MFNNSISVLSRAAARFKRIVLIAEVFIQLLFVGYYAYLLVVHRDDLILLIGYSVLTALGASIFFVMLFTLDPYRKKVLEFKRYIRRVLRVISWTGKVIVIGYNIYTLIRFGMTETGQLLLVFSIIIFFTEVVLFVVSNIINHYYQLFVFALQMDYQHMIGDNTDMSEKPIGRILLNVNESYDLEEEVTSLFIEQEIYEAVKKYSEQDASIEINRRKLEKQLFNYYSDSLYYYKNNNKLIELANEVNQIETKEDNYQHLYVLKFFLANQVEKTYVGLTNQYFRFVLAGLSHYLDHQQMSAIDVIYRIIIKHLVNNKDWNKQLNVASTSEKKSFFSFFKKGSKEKETPETVSGSMFNEVNQIVSASVELMEKELKKTVSGEIEGIVSDTIKKKVTGSIRSRIRGFFHRKKKE